ncbi:hypothetical protein M0R45_030699 [Rubus argutus]|uniref:Uncharacterized protein n=1 Tax=Rubus argutus TaxID=59490 RepID=A0AAW1WBS6_RUBAR
MVINIAAAYMFDKDSSSWFFPTDFGESARSINGKVRIGVSIPLVILRSGLQRFHRLLKSEIWDNSYEVKASTFRVEIARTTMVLLQNVFANEMTSWRDV